MFGTRHYRVEMQKLNKRKTRQFWPWAMQDTLGGNLAQRLEPISLCDILLARVDDAHNTQLQKKRIVGAHSVYIVFISSECVYLTLCNGA